MKPLKETVEAHRTFYQNEITRMSQWILGTFPVDRLVERIEKAEGDLSDVGEVYVSRHYEYGKDEPGLTLFLKKDCATSTLPRRLLVALDIPTMKKEAESGGESLAIGAMVDGVWIEGRGYVPDGCVIEWEEVVIPATTRRQAKVVCGGADASS